MSNLDNCADRPVHVRKATDLVARKITGMHNHLTGEENLTRYAVALCGSVNYYETSEAAEQFISRTLASENRNKGKRPSWFGGRRT
jgi:hypothetical protein